MRSLLPLMPVMPALLAACWLELPPALGQACGCACAQPMVGYRDATGRCPCPCPPKAPKAGGGEHQPLWSVEPLDDAGFGWPWWSGW